MVGGDLGGELVAVWRGWPSEGPHDGGRSAGPGAGVTSVASPCPSCPQPLPPQLQPDSSAPRTGKCFPPAATSTAVGWPATGAGGLACTSPQPAAGPVPSRPAQFWPQAQTVPSRRSAMVWTVPAATAATSSNPGTRTGPRRTVSAGRPS